MTKHLQVARDLIGETEVPGPRNNPAIMGWANRVTARALGIAYGGDHVPWCGLFAAYCVVQAGLTPPPISIRAKSWATWGQPIPTSARIPLGAIAVFERKGGGHVGFVTGVYANGDLLILGGNQGDAVNERRFPRAPTPTRPDIKLVALRWPNGVAMAGPVQLVSAGTMTTGEA